MELNISLSEELKPIDVEKVADFIASLQKGNGEILVAGRQDDPGIISKAPWD